MFSNEYLNCFLGCDNSTRSNSSTGDDGSLNIMILFLYLFSDLSFFFFIFCEQGSIADYLASLKDPAVFAKALQAALAARDNAIYLQWILYWYAVAK